MTPLRMTLLSAALAVAAGAALPALAADPDFCRDYARNAIQQYRIAMDHRRCAERVHDFAVWSPDFQHHYGWCLGVSRDQAWAGRNQRQELLSQCAYRHDDWRY